ncbi:MAG: DPP IV N-terminal domain-containing protein [Alistipes sp.]|nr:DPP IV N-terminal domain-containing protein [Alistipes sp.]
MKQIFLIVAAALLLATPAFAQENSQRMLTPEDVVLNRELRPQSFRVQWIGESDCYATTEGDMIVSYDAASGKSSTLLTLSDLNSILGSEYRQLPYYYFDSEQNIIFQVRGYIYTINLDSKQLVATYDIPRGDNLTRQSGKGGMFAYTKENNLYLFDGKKSVAITTESDTNIVSGQSVSRNEFGIDGGIFFSPDASKIAFYQKDESAVGTFPLLDINSRTGTLREIKYPMNGMPSEKVRLGIYDIASAKSVYADVTDFDAERYLTCITFSPDSRKIYIQVLDRKQNDMRLNIYDAESGAYIKTVLEEHNDKFVEPYAPLVFLDENPEQFIYATDNRDGYKSLYLCDDNGIIKRLTPCDADVAYLAQDKKHIYYTSAEVSPIDNHLFRVNISSGKATRLTSEEGWHSPQVSHSGRYFLDTYSSLNVPNVVYVKATSGKQQSELFRAADPTVGYNYLPIELGTVKSADGKFDNYYRLIKPANFDATKRYPVIVYVYGGPHSQMVTNSYLGQLRRWEMLMAQRGYVVFVMDNRGTSNRGAEYEKAIHRRCGVAEMEDQIAALDWLLSHEWCDRERVGVHGWSYGGFMTISLMTTYPDYFKVGVAGGPVIDWKWYEVMYGERYMDSTHDNPEGFAATSLIPKAKNLKGKLLICQGAVDNVVVWQHSLSFVQECISHHVQVDYFPYPVAEHNVFGPDAVHLYQKITDYFVDNL